LKRFVEHDLHYEDYAATLLWYETIGQCEFFDDNARAFLGCNDRFFLLTALLGRRDACHPWLFTRCREVEADSDGYLDLWARYHFKSTIGTFAGAIQEIVRDPEITICILSCTRDIAAAFLTQIQQELQHNDTLKRVYKDVLWDQAGASDRITTMPRQLGIPTTLSVAAFGHRKAFRQRSLAGCARRSAATPVAVSCIAGARAVHGSVASEVSFAEATNATALTAAAGVLMFDLHAWETPAACS
jgi:hypothetical protein